MRVADNNGVWVAVALSAAVHVAVFFGASGDRRRISQLSVPTQVSEWVQLEPLKAAEASLATAALQVKLPEPSEAVPSRRARKARRRPLAAAQAAATGLVLKSEVPVPATEAPAPVADQIVAQTTEPAASDGASKRSTSGVDAKGTAGSSSPAPTAQTRSARVRKTQQQRRREVARYLEVMRRRVAHHRRYPFAARRARLEGKVCVDFVVDGKGRISKPRSACGDPPGVLQEAAFAALRKATPFPEAPSLVRTPLRVRLPVEFRLR